MLWLRIYAIKLANGVYIITGGAIKLTATMQEREHTQAEVSRWLSGNHNFTLATLAKISVALGVNLITVQLIADIKALRLRISHKVASRKSRLDVELRILDKLLALGKNVATAVV